MADRKFYNPDFGSTQLKNAIAHTFAGDPGSPASGQIWYDSTLQRLGFRGTSTTYKVVRDGGDLTSNSVATSAINGLTAAITGTRLDQLTAPNTSVAFNSQRITGVADPTGAQDAATKNYVDTLVNGLNWKDSVRAATTANITLSGAQTIDGVSVIAGDRVLVKAQTTASANGIYVAASGAWSRATDADSNTELVQATVFVEEGTTNADTIWTQTTNAPITVGTTSLSYAQIGAGAGYTAGNGIGIAGNTISVTADPTPADIIVGSPGIKTDPAKVAHISTGTIGDGTTTNIVYTHGLGTRAVHVTVYLASGTFEEVTLPIEHTSTTTVTIYFPTAPTSGQYVCVVHG